MKRFIALHSNVVSAVSSKEEAHKWAAKQLSERAQISEVKICEVIEVAERTTPTIAVKPFFVQLDPAVKTEDEVQAA